MRLCTPYLPTTLFLLHAVVFGAWLVDDAGISLAYSRNLAAGYGLVSQPGMPPVEGYSNPLWVLLLSGGFALTAMSPVVLAKLLSGALAAITFAVCFQTLSENLKDGKFIALLALCLISVQTSIVMWAISGLENPLTLLLTTLLIAGLLSPSLNSPKIAGFMGCSVAVLALTRPEGVVYA